MFHSPIQTNKAQITFLEQFCQIINFDKIYNILKYDLKSGYALLELQTT